MVLSTKKYSIGLSFGLAAPLSLRCVAALSMCRTIAMASAQTSDLIVSVVQIF
jgi:hypothetical protein